MSEVYGVEFGDCDSSYVPVAFTSRGLAEEHAGKNGSVVEIPVLDHPPVQVKHYRWHGVVWEDGRLMNSDRALNEDIPDWLSRHGNPKRYGESWDSWDYSVPELTRNVGPWSPDKHPEAVSIEVQGSDREAVKAEFYRLVAQEQERVEARASSLLNKSNQQREHR